MKNPNKAKQAEAITIFVVIIIITITAFTYFQNPMVIVAGAIVAAIELLTYGEYFPDDRNNN